MIAFMLIILFIGAGFFAMSLVSDTSKSLDKQQPIDKNQTSKFGQESESNTGGTNVPVKNPEDPVSIISWKISGSNKDVVYVDLAISTLDALKNKRVMAYCDLQDNNLKTLETKKKFVFLTQEANSKKTYKDIDFGRTKVKPTHLSCRIDQDLLVSAKSENVQLDESFLPALPKNAKPLKSEKSIDDLPLPELK